MDQQTDIRFDLLDPKYRADPYPVYDRLREGGPVRQLAAGLWVITGHAEAREALEHPDFAHWTRTDPASAPEGTDFEAVSARWFALVHPGRKTGFRRALLALMGGEALERIGTGLHEHAGVLLDRAVTDGGMDVIADYARPLTQAVAADMMGLDAAEAAGFADAMQAASGSALSGFVQSTTVEADPVGEWIAAQIARCMRNPGHDMISLLLAAASRGDCDARDLPAFCRLLIFAATDNMTNFIGNATFSLLAQPDAMAHIAQAGVDDHAIAELLRHDSPVQALPLTALREARVTGVTVEPGETALVLIGAANHDPAVFAEPSRIAFDRIGAATLSFGSGALSCLGARMARRIGALTLALLFSRLPAMRCDTGTVHWQAGMPMLRGLECLPVKL
ncbi:MAG: cytochrome P450 [Acidihalobacter sp.]